MPVLEKQMMRAQSGVQVMHQIHVGRFVQAAALRQESNAREQFLGVLVAIFRQQHRMRFFIDKKVTGRLFLLLLDQQWRHFIHPVIDFGSIFGLSRDDQRRARFVDQYRIDLVNDRKVQAALVTIRHRHRHVVAKIVKAEFVVGAVGNVGRVGGVLVCMRHLREDYADR